MTENRSLADPPPKVFASHASEDKEHFVLEFGTILQARGVDAWLDKWELSAGDSLMDKIFEEGIGQSDAFVIVLSQASVQKRWVREELNSGLVSRIERGSLLIPVIIDDCEVPQAVKDIAWIKLDEVGSIERVAALVADAVFGVKSKPPIGKPPAYALDSAPTIYGLDRLDVIVLKGFCEKAISQGNLISVYVEDVWKQIEQEGVPREKFEESVEALIQGVCLEKTGSPFLRISHLGMEEYASAFIPDYADLRRSVIAKIVNENARDVREISAQLDRPVLLIQQIVTDLKHSDLLAASVSSAGMIIHKVSPTLKRELRK